MAGTDPTDDGRVVPGYADRHMLELLTEAGFSFPEAVKICSMNAAKYLGIAKEIGTIATGKRADLVLIDGDPEVHISDVPILKSFLKMASDLTQKNSSNRLRGK